MIDEYGRAAEFKVSSRFSKSRSKSKYQSVYDSRNNSKNSLKTLNTLKSKQLNFNSGMFNTDEIKSYGRQGTKNSYSSKFGGYSSSNYSNFGNMQNSGNPNPNKKSAYFRNKNGESGSNNTLKNYNRLNGSSNPSASHLKSGVNTQFSHQNRNSSGAYRGYG
jgi:hypothetical protein